jgi:allantoate deiminase
VTVEGPPPQALELVAFADEEGARFRTAYLGSATYTGGFEPPWLDVVDAEGVSLREAILEAGGDPEAAAAAPTPELAGYVEVHIEQGPVLEREGLPVGLVSAIAGQSCAVISVTGQAGHAGTLPMAGRRDALAAAAETVLAVERLGRAEPGLVATVGSLTLSTNAANVVPGAARLLLDVRHAEDGVRCRALDEIRAETERIAAGRGVDVAWTPRYDKPAVELDPELRGRLAEAIRAQGLPVRELVSGAGHDAVVLSALCPAAMLFVRCAGGISHDPRESVAEEDVAIALDVLERFVRGSRVS